MELAADSTTGGAAVCLTHPPSRLFASPAAVSPLPVIEYELIGRANFSFFRFGQDPIIKPHTIKPAEPYERGPKDTFLVNPVR